MNNISLQPLAPQNIQHQADLQVLLKKIKSSNVNSICENKKETVVANILDKSNLFNQDNTRIIRDESETNKLLNKKIVSPPNTSFREYSRNSSNYSDYSNVSNKPSKETTVNNIFEYLEIDPVETINVYDGFVPILYKFSRINNFGPLAWISTLLKDPFVSPLREEVLRHKRNIYFKHQMKMKLIFMINF